jgi:hypothetical protein
MTAFGFSAKAAMYTAIVLIVIGVVLWLIGAISLTNAIESCVGLGLVAVINLRRHHKSHDGHGPPD